MPLVVGIADVLAAFGQITHEFLHTANAPEGVDINVRVAMLNDCLDKYAQIKIGIVGCTSAFPFSTGSRQGGVRTQQGFNDMMRCVLQDLLDILHIVGYGVDLNEEGRATIKMNR